MNRKGPYGAIIILAPLMGSDEPSIMLGTLDRYSSSSLPSSSGEATYQEPAFPACLVLILCFSFYGWGRRLGERMPVKFETERFARIRDVEMESQVGFAFRPQ